MSRKDYDLEQAENRSVNPSSTEDFATVLDRRLDRRTLVRHGIAGGGAAIALGGLFSGADAATRKDPLFKIETSFDFDEIAHGADETHHVASGYDARILLRWGDPITADAPPFDPLNQTPEAQEKQFGYNNDFLGFIPLEPGRGLLCVNHEYTNEELMFPGLGRQDRKGFADMTKALVDIEQAAHGGSIVEIENTSDGWRPVLDSPFNRRITVKTAMELKGPAAGHPKLRTSEDPEGRFVQGTVNNCAGGITPWGTYLMCEENFNGYFSNKTALDAHPDKAALERYGIPGGWYAWERYYDRFDIAKEPNEPNRFGWVVEVNALDPASRPVKRTALGRFKHEGARPVVNKDGRVVVYMGDDQRFEYIYKFVTRRRYNPADPAGNRDLLDDGTLYAAKFHDDGRLSWLPLVHGEGKLTAENGFADQADIALFTRRAADLAGATPMDRPEDIVATPGNGDVYCNLTNNTKRSPQDVDGPNPRARNRFGQVLRISEPGEDFAATEAIWDLLAVCGDPADKTSGAIWNPSTSENGWFASPDNCMVDTRGRLWISSDQGDDWIKTGTADGLWAMQTEGSTMGMGMMFFRAPIGAEVCSPCFTPDDEALFIAVQHPAADGAKSFPGFARASTYEDPATRWPDFDEGMPTRPAVVMVTKQGGGRIG